MLSITKISKPQLPELVKISYEGDSELFEKYHPAKSDEQGSIENTLKMIDDVSKEHKCSYYKVLFQQKPIGYFVVWDKFLYSFCINIKYRKKEILINWWAKIKSVLGKTFRTMLYKDNARAIAFVLRQGMKIDITHENVITLINT